MKSASIMIKWLMSDILSDVWFFYRTPLTNWFVDIYVLNIFTVMWIGLCLFGIKWIHRCSTIDQLYFLYLKNDLLYILNCLNICQMAVLDISGIPFCRAYHDSIMYSRIKTLTNLIVFQNLIVFFFGNMECLDSSVAFLCEWPNILLLKNSECLYI